MNEPKISVIIPVYKVEPYIRRCLNSVVNQTYRNLQIILVDDGSPDNCGAICDEYAAMDERIQVIHKSNGGLSSARNAGLALADGEYIGWVDSDDWIEPDMFEKLLQKAVAENADVVCCGRYKEYPDRTVIQTWDCDRRLTREEAMDLLLENHLLQNNVWDKLWKRSLYCGIEFPEGRNFEDIAVGYRLFEKADSIINIPDVLYHYLLRSDSIIGNASIKVKMDNYLACYDRYLDMRSRWPEQERTLCANCVAAAISIWCSYFANPKEDREKYAWIYQEISVICRAHYQDALQNLSLGMAGRAVVRLTCYPEKWSFAMAYLIGILYRIRNKHAL